EVLTEATLLALEHVGQRLERAVARPGHRTTTAAVVEQRVDGLLKHALLVVDDDLRRTEVKQSLESVVAVDHATVEVVQVGGREAATVELHHRAQVRRDDRDGVQHHADRLVAGLAERVDDLEALERADLALALAGLDDLAERLDLGGDIEVLEALLDRRGAHVALEVLAEPLLHLAVEQLVTHQVLDLEVLEGVPDLFKAGELGLRALADRGELTLGPVAYLALGVGLGALGLQRREVVLESPLAVGESRLHAVG